MPPRQTQKKKKPNPISAAVSSWLSILAEFSVVPVELERERQHLVSLAPKRWVVYPPMLLLPSGSFAAEPWSSLLQSLPAEQTDRLWRGILETVSTKSAVLTHLAVNEGIRLHLEEETTAENTADTTAGGTAENILRSPSSSLRILYGDFGPCSPVSSPSPAPSKKSQDNAHTAPPPPLDKRDADAAFWVSTRQNGITQVWAPRWTMFSRGNIKEKARLLSAFPDRDRRDHEQPGVSEGASGASRWAVDLYAGIGYFVFSYARLGLRVLCWELNPWSVEGLVRGARANGFSVRVVSPGAHTETVEDTADTTVTGEGGPETSTKTDEPPLIRRIPGDEQIIVFLEDNSHAPRRIRQFRETTDPEGTLDIVHVNCGFLPSSMPSWRPAWEIQRPDGVRGQGWLHLHENVGAADIERRRAEIQAVFDTWSGAGGATTTREAREGRVEHVELVKTFAPGVWHCVFDVYTRCTS